MIQIANPIYDVVFKYMMKDNKVAKLLLSAIIGEEIIELEFKPTEVSLPLHESITVLRMDFKATIQLKNGNFKVIIIEIQKAKTHTDIMRFRRYLGEQYIEKENSIIKEVIKSKDDKDIILRDAIPILSIYFLGHRLEHAEDIPVIKVSRNYIDVATGKILEEKEAFIEALTHDSFIIQIPFVKGKRRTELEKLLYIFDQSNADKKHGNLHTLLIQDEDVPEKYEPIIKRLLQAIANAELRNQMNAEDEFFEEMQNNARIIHILKEEAEEQKRIAEEQSKIAEEQSKIAEEQSKIAEERNKVIKKAMQNMQSNNVSLEEIANMFALSMEDVKRILNN